jgi:hypothetical protein
MKAWYHLEACTIQKDRELVFQSLILFLKLKSIGIFQYCHNQTLTTFVLKLLKGNNHYTLEVLLLGRPRI